MLWRDILPSVVFVLNTSISSTTKCIPFTVVHGRKPSLQQDILINTTPCGMTAISPGEYIKDLKIQLKEIVNKVTKYLEISRKNMMTQYNKNIRCFDYSPGEKVWIRKKHYKPGENRKLAPRYAGPYHIVEKMPNGVNYRIILSNGKESIIHHNRLKKYTGTDQSCNISSRYDNAKLRDANSENIHYDLSSEESTSEEEPEVTEIPERRYPLRTRTQREIEGTVPWDAVDHLV